MSTRPEVAARIVASIGLDRHIPILDLGCGDGVFLEAAADHLRRQQPVRFLTADALAGVLTGVEMDGGATARAKERLTERFAEPSGGWDIRNHDALTMPEAERYRAVIGNPPWVRLHHLEPSARSAARANFKSAKGAFDLCYLFIEKSVRLLEPGGQLGLIVPMGIANQPAAAALRNLVTATGTWTIERLPVDSFFPSADVDPGVLRFVKDVRTEHRGSESDVRRPVLEDIAFVGAGVATGADSIFLVNAGTTEEWGLEHDWLRPAIRGRDIGRQPHHAHGVPMRIIWPYRRGDQKWILDDLSSAPGVRSYLEHHRQALLNRPRLANIIRRSPSTWYRFIDPNRHRDDEHGLRIALPDIFSGSAFLVVDDPRAVVLNTCFQIAARSGFERQVIHTLESPSFWETLSATSRSLSSGYHRTSASELRSTPLTQGKE